MGEKSNKEVSELKQEIATFDDTKRKLSERNEEILKMEKLATEASNNLNDLQKQNQEIKSEKQNEIDTLNMELNDAKSQVSKQNDNISTIQEDKTILNSKINALQFELTQCRKEVDCI